MIAVVTAGFKSAKDIVWVKTKLINNPIPTWKVLVAVTTEYPKKIVPKNFYSKNFFIESYYYQIHKKKKYLAKNTLGHGVLKIISTSNGNSFLRWIINALLSC